MINDKPKAKIEKVIQVKCPTHFKDIKVGDIVITAELHKIISIKNRNFIECTDVGGVHGCIKHLGWGQQGLLKVVGGVTE